MNSRRYKAAVFDLDGTLADTLESIAAASNQALKIMGYDGFPTEAYKYYAGAGAKELMRKVLHDSGDIHAERLHEMIPLYAETFEQCCMYKVAPYNGIPELLKALKEQGMKLAVLTNKPHNRAIHVLSALFEDGLFDYIIGQTDDLPRKPDPAGAFLITEAFEVKPEECIYLGDTDIDMQTGRAAGMYTIGVLWGFREREELIDSGAQALVKSPEEVLLLL